MTDGQLLYAVMVLIYFGECLVWLPDGAYACLRGVGGRRRIRLSGFKIGKARSGWVMSGVFPLFSTVFVTRPWPVSLSAEAMAAFSIETPNPGLRPVGIADQGWRWNDVEKIQREGKKLLVNGEFFLVESSPEAAEKQRHFLELVWKAEPGEREALISQCLERAWNPHRVKRLIGFWEGQTRAMRWFSSFLLLALFVAFPACYIFFGASRELLACGLACLCLMLQIALEFFFLHRRAFPDVKYERWQWFFLILLVPQQTLRAHDLLLKAILSEYHPLVVAEVALKKGSEGRREFMGRVYRDLKYPLPWKARASQQVQEVVSQFEEQFLLPSLERFESRHEEELKELREPVREEGDLCFCDRCNQTFSAEVDSCPDCVGIATKSWGA